VAVERDRHFRDTFGVKDRSYSYDDLYFTEHPYGLVWGVVTGLPARDSSSAALT